MAARFLTPCYHQAGLFTLVEIQLLSFVKNDANFHRSVESSAKHALLMLTYLALFFSISAAVSGLILTDEFGKLPMRASGSRKSDPIQQGLFDSGTLDLLQRYGAKRSWIWIMWHCECAPVLPTLQRFLITKSQGCSPSLQAPFL
jgi:hypothetical protein